MSPAGPGSSAMVTCPETFSVAVGVHCTALFCGWAIIIVDNAHKMPFVRRNHLPMGMASRAVAFPQPFNAARAAP